MSQLELFTGPGETLGDRLRAAAQARALMDIVGAAKRTVDEALEDSVREAADQFGAAFTARDGGWSAVLTDPQPKPRVSDPQAFGVYVAANLPGVIDVRERQRVEVADHDRAAEVLLGIQNADGRTGPMDAEWLYQSLRVVTEYVLPEDPFGPLVASGRCKVTDDALIDLETGETVPGVTVDRQPPRLQVRGKPEAKAATAGEVAAVLGIRPELYDGGGR